MSLTSWIPYLTLTFLFFCLILLEQSLRFVITISFLERHTVETDTITTDKSLNVVEVKFDRTNTFYTWRHEKEPFYNHEEST